MNDQYEEEEEDFLNRLSVFFTRTSVSLIDPPLRTPPLLREIWRIGNEWHLLESGHHNVFGFNIFSIETVDKVSADVFGDDDERQAWAGREAMKGRSSCAETSWRAFASFSEFDYLFICIDPEIIDYGKVKHIVNNCCEESESMLLITILRVLLIACEDRRELLIDSKSPQVPLGREDGLNYSLKRLRRAVLDS
jgi:hypothetical protein